MMTDPERKDEAIAAMWLYVDSHPVRELFASAAAWKTWRFGLRRLVEGQLPEQWRVDKHGGRPVDGWELRAELFSRAVDLYAADVVRPDRRPNERAMPVDQQLARIVIPQEFDRFAQAVARTRPAPGSTEAERVRAAGVEMPSEAGIRGWEGKEPPPAPEGPRLGGYSTVDLAVWAGEHQAEANACFDQARTELGESAPVLLLAGRAKAHMAMRMREQQVIPLGIAAEVESG